MALDRLLAQPVDVQASPRPHNYGGGKGETGELFEAGLAGVGLLGVEIRPDRREVAHPLFGSHPALAGGYSNVNIA